MNKAEKHARKLYEHNKQFIAANMEKLTSLDLCKYARKQDQLYMIFSS